MVFVFLRFGVILQNESLVEHTLQSRFLCQLSLNYPLQCVRLSCSRMEPYVLEVIDMKILSIIHTKIILYNGN